MELKAEFNCPVALLQLRLEGIFLEFRIKLYQRICQITSQSPGYRAPVLKIEPIKSQKPKLKNDSTDTVWMFERRKNAAVLTCDNSPKGITAMNTSPRPESHKLGTLNMRL